MATVTPELRQEIERANGEPVRLEDPETHETYLLRRERSRQEAEDIMSQVPEGFRQAKTAFFRDLPEMLQDKKLRGKWVAYHRGERVAVGKRQRDVIKVVLKRDIPDNEFLTFVVEPHESEEPEGEIVTPDV